MRPELVLTLDDLATTLHATGAAVWDDALSPAIAATIRREVLALWAAERFVPATVGRARHLRPDVRGDDICWLLPAAHDNGDGGAKETDDGADSFGLNTGLYALRALLSDIRGVMSKRAFVHLDETEMLASHYPMGGFYVPHVDRFVGTSNRFFTFVYFLNTDWVAADGGELHIMGTGEQSIAPRLGRLALFYTPEVLHEVVVTQTDRFAVTGWLGKRTAA